MLESGKLKIGLNYWASENATRMWRNWKPEAIEADMAVMEQHGVELLRVFPLWPDFQPIRLLQYGTSSGTGTKDREVCLGEDETPLPDTPAGQAGMDETMLERFRQFCDMAQHHGIHLIVAIMTVHMTGRHFVPPAIENRDLFTDPFALKWEIKFYDCFVKTMKDHPAIAAWETGNEMNYTGPVKNAEHAWVWTRMMHDVIRLADPSRPIVGVMAEGLDPMKAKWLIADQGELADYGSIHRYDILNAAASDGLLHIRNVCRASAECRIVSDIGGKPCFTEETGNWRNLALSLDGVGKTLNCLLWNAWAENCGAFLWWCAFDQQNLSFAPYHWGDWPGLEHGVFSSDRKPHPAAKAMRDFGKMLRILPFEKLPETKPDAICLVDDMEIASTSFVLARQAGINLKFQATRSRLTNADFYFIPSVADRGGLSLEDWRKLRQNVENGATCYISADDTDLPELRDFCGMQIERRRRAIAPMQCTVDGIALSLSCALEKKILLEGAEVVLADNDGNPLLLRNRYGKGTVFTLLFALEKTLQEKPRALEEPWWKLYRMILNKKLVMNVNDHAIVLTEHPFDNDSTAVVAINCSDEERQFAPEISPDWKLESVIGKKSPENGNETIPPGDGLIFMLSKKQCR